MKGSLDSETSPEFDLLNSLNMPIFFKNKIGTYIFCNEAFAKFLDRSKHHIIGKSDLDIAPPCFANACISADKLLLEKGGAQLYDTMILINNKPQMVRFDKKLIHGTDGFAKGIIGSIVPLSEPELLAKRCFNLLTSREKEILNLLLKGGSAKSMAASLQLSSNTINGHLKSVYRKLNVNSKNAALSRVLQINSTLGS